MYNYVKGFIHAIFALFAFCGVIMIAAQLEENDKPKEKTGPTPLFDDPSIKI